MRTPDTLQWLVEKAVPSGDPNGPNSLVRCSCWACASPMTIRLHLSEASTSMPPSQCQACGAITDHSEARQRFRGPESPIKNVLRILSGYRHGVVVVFVSVILSVICSGSLVILPISLSSSRGLLVANQAITWLLTLFVFFNFFSAMSSFTSSVKACFGTTLPSSPLQSKEGSVSPMCYKGWSWCRTCQFYKPAEASHCRICGVCIVGKDHHCVFINNCVGRGNMRSFLLLLLFTLVSILFCFSHMVVFLVQERASFAESLLMAWARSKGPLILFFYLNVFLSLKWSHVIGLWNVFFCISILYGVGTLLWSILESFADVPDNPELRGADGKKTRAARIISRLSLIIRGKKGHGSLWMWIWPIWNPSQLDSDLSLVSSRDTWCSPPSDAHLSKAE
jgi:hypothetical protein